MTKSEYDKAEREMRKRHHLCIQCGKQDEYTLVGRSRCSECAEQARVADAKKAAERKKRRADANRNAKAQPFIKPAIAEHENTYREIIESELKGG